MPQEHHVYWEKPAAILRAAEDRWDRIVWLDADAVMLDAIFPEFDTHLGMTWHAPISEPYHYNAGVIYIQNSESCRELIKAWIDTDDDGHKWHDQWALNKLIRKQPGIVTKLDHKYNSVDWNPYCRSDSPIVKAWHGRNGECLKEMTLAIQGNSSAG